jgi:hypothetical protein
MRVCREGACLTPCTLPIATRGGARLQQPPHLLSSLLAVVCCVLCKQISNTCFLSVGLSCLFPRATPTQVRPNLVVSGFAAYAEDAWPAVSLGDRLHADVLGTCPRCELLQVLWPPPLQGRAHACCVAITTHLLLRFTTDSCMVHTMAHIP